MCRRLCFCFVVGGLARSVPGLGAFCSALAVSNALSNLLRPLENPHGRGRARGRRPVGLWRLARSWWFLVWLAVGSALRWCAGPAQYEHTLWRDGGPRLGSGESQGSSVGLQKEQIDVQAGLSAMMSEFRNMAVPVTGLQQAAASATPAVQIPCKQSQSRWRTSRGWPPQGCPPGGWQIGARITLAPSTSKSRTARTS